MKKNMNILWDEEEENGVRKPMGEGGG